MEAGGARLGGGPYLEGTVGSVASAGPAGNVWGGLEIAALAMLVVGGFVMPLLGPAIGLVLVWFSPRWTAPQKLVATGLGLLPVIVIAFYLLVGP